MTVELVCSVCGSTALDWSNTWSADPSRRWAPQRSVDDRWPLAHCRSHVSKREYWVPVIAASAFRARQQMASVPTPIDLFGSLPEDERKALERPIK